MITVIFPIYNCEELLNNAINNILNQNFKDFELICINNYSTDSSLSIIKKFEKQDSRVKIFNCDSNHNLSYFINHCIETSKNKYIYFFEPHFILKNNTFDSLISISETTNIDYLIFNYEIIYQNNPINLKFHLDKNYEIYENIDLKSDFLFNIPVSLGNVFFLKSFLLSDNFYFNERLHENFYKLRFNSKKSIALNIPLATVEMNMQNRINTIFDESYALFSIFQWLYECKDIYEYYKITLIKFVLGNLKELYQTLNNLNNFSDNIPFYYYEKNKFDNYLTYIFDKFYFDFKIYEDIQQIDESLSDFFNEFLINKGEYRLSIVIPAFNCESYIKDTLNSIIKQTLNFNTIEVILVDDYSNDDTPVIIKEYSEKYSNIRPFFLEKNSKYAGKPRNIALSNVSSNYVSFLDADDYYYPHACEKLYYNMLYDDKVDLVIGNFSMDKVDGGKKIMIDGGLSYFKNLNNFDVLKFDSLTENEYILSSANVWNKIFKINVIRDNNIIFPEGVPAQDSGFLFHYLLNTKKLKFINDTVVHYHNLRNSEGNKSVTHLRNELNIMGRIKVYHWMYDIGLEYDVENLFVRNILRVKLPYWFNQLLTTELSNDDLKKIFIEHRVLFKRCVDYNVTLPKRLVTIFKLIAESKFEDTVDEYKNIKLKSL